MREVSWIIRLCACGALVTGFVAGAAWAQEEGAAPAAEKAVAPAAEAQVWMGAVELPGGMTLQFAAKFSPDGAGGLTGTIDVPAQEILDWELRDISLTATDLKFSIAPPQAPVEAWAVFQVQIDEGGKVSSATMSQQGQTFPVTIRKLAPGEDPMSDLRPQTPKPPFPYSQRELTLQNAADGTQLVGTLFIPGKPPEGELVSQERHPAVIFITGSGPQDRDESLLGHKPFLVIADHLARNGIASFRMDDRGVGGSSGSSMESTIYDFAGDIKAAFGALKLQPDIDPNRIGLLGHSEGGSIAPLVASEVAEVRFIVLLAGTGVTGREVMTLQAQKIARAAGIDEAVLEGQKDAYEALMDAVVAKADQATVDEAVRQLMRAQMGEQEIPPEQMEQVVQAQRGFLTSAWTLAFLKHDPRVPLRSVRCSVLAINGELDLQVDADQNLTAIEAALKEASNSDVTIKRLAGHNHLFQRAETGLPTEYHEIDETISPETLELVTTWIRAHVGL